jgi:hypothetical protein
MTETAVSETELSSLTKEDSKKRLTCGMERPRRLEWMSRRNRRGDDDHEDGSLRSSLGNHKT